MALETSALVDALVSHALTTGLFDRCNGHEPKNAPGNGLSGAVWVEDMRPARGESGLAATTTRLLFRVRLYVSMLLEPQDQIDPIIMEAVDALMRAYSGDFTLDGLVRNIDLMGRQGDPLGGRAGYLEQDSKVYRVFTLTVPVLINDLYVQAP